MAYEEFKTPGSRTEQEYGSGQYSEDTFKDKFQSGTHNVKEKLRYGLDQTREQSKKAVENIGYQIEERPLVSVLIAFGVGLLLGTMLSGSRMGSMLSGSRIGSVLGGSGGDPDQVNEQLSQGGNPPPTI